MIFFKAQKVQRLAEILRQVAKAIEDEGGDLSRAEQDLDEVARGAGIDLGIARMADAATLERVLAPAGSGSSDRCWLAAEVLYLDGLVALGRGREADARARLTKARRLYGLVEADLALPDEAPDPDSRLRRIADLLED